MKKSADFKVAHDGLLLLDRDGVGQFRHEVPNNTGSDVGDRNTWPRMCGSSAVGIQAQVRQSVEQEIDRDAHLHARQMHSQADVRAMAPCDVCALLAEDVEAVGIGVAVLVPG